MKRLISIIWCFMVVAGIGATNPWPSKPFGSGAETPRVAFRSTSAMPSIHSTYSSSPMLGEDGTAINGFSSEAAHAPTIRRAGGVEPTDDDEELPLSDTILPLLLMAIIYIGLRARKRA